MLPFPEFNPQVRGIILGQGVDMAQVVRSCLLRFAVIFGIFSSGFVCLQGSEPILSITPARIQVEPASKTVFTVSVKGGDDTLLQQPIWSATEGKIAGVTTTAVYSAKYIKGLARISVQVGQGTELTTAHAEVKIGYAPKVRPFVTRHTYQDKPISVVFRASDWDRDPLEYRVVDQPTHGVLSGSGASRTYTPAVGYFGVDSFTYIASDGWQDSEPVRVLILIYPRFNRPTVTWTSPESIPYGTPLTAEQLNAFSTIPGTFRYWPREGMILEVGTHKLWAIFFPADPQLWTTAVVRTTIRVSPRVPELSWPTPTSILFGTPLSSAQLRASSPVPGTFSYQPAAGAVLEVGMQTLSATFVPSDRAHWESATVTTALQVLPVNPQLFWPAPAPIAFGQGIPLGALQATANVPGVFHYEPPVGTVLSEGQHVLSAFFTPSDSVHYTTGTITTTLTVERSSPGYFSLPPTADPQRVTGVSTLLHAKAVESNGAAITTFIWEVADGAPARVLLNRSEHAEPGTMIARFTKAGTYQFTCTAVNALGGTITGTVEVVVEPQASVLTIDLEKP